MTRPKPAPPAPAEPVQRRPPRPVAEIIADRTRLAWNRYPQLAAMCTDLATLHPDTRLELAASAAAHWSESRPTSTDASTWPIAVIRHAWWVASTSALFGRRGHERPTYLGLIAPSIGGVA